jgi:dihydroceramidase
VDELSMHLLTTPLIYRLLTFKASAQRTAIVGVILSIIFTIVMVTHMVMDEFVLHAVSFGTGVYIIGNRTLRLIPQVAPSKYVEKRLSSVAVFGCGRRTSFFYSCILD